VADANHVVKVGQRVKVTVMKVDLERNRIALSMKSKPDPTAPTARAPAGDGERRARRPDARGDQKTQRGDRAARPNTAPRTAPPRPPKPGDIAPNGMRFR